MLLRAVTDVYWYLVQALYNVCFVQSLIKVSFEFSEEERMAWQSKVKQNCDVSTCHSLYCVRAVVVMITANITRKCIISAILVHVHVHVKQLYWRIAWLQKFSDSLEWLLGRVILLLSKSKLYDDESANSPFVPAVSNRS